MEGEVKFWLYHAFAISSFNTEELWRAFPWDDYEVAMLFSFAFRKEIDNFFSITEGSPGPRRCMLDSGAYTAYREGKLVDMNELIQYARDGEHHIRWDEKVGLDVVGYAEQTHHNCWIMRDAGVDVIPVFHYTPDYRKHLRWLKTYKDEDWRTIGIASHEARRQPKVLYRFLGDCFRILWPHRIHHFGEARIKTLETFPFTSCDTSAFLRRLVHFGEYDQFKRMKIKGLTVHDSHMALKGEIIRACRIQAQMRARWAVVHKEITGL